MTNTSTVARVASSFSPSCSVNTEKIDGMRRIASVYLAGAKLDREAMATVFTKTGTR